MSNGGFTREELEASREGCSNPYLRLAFDKRGYAWSQPGPDWAEVRQALLRLALAHPDRAHLALGEGWLVNTSGELVWQFREGLAPYLIVSRRRGFLGYIDPLEQIPPEFDAALARGRRIAEAWQALTSEPNRD